MFDIREATMYDIPGIDKCDRASFPKEKRWDSDFYEDYIKDWPRLVYVAEDNRNGSILGYILAEMEGDEGTAERHGYIKSLGVHPENHRSGIATKLMAAVHKAMVKKYGSAEYVKLHVRESNKAAIKLYTDKFGYVKCGTKVEFFDDGEDAYVMRKQLQRRKTEHNLRNGGGCCFSGDANVKFLEGKLERLQVC